MKRFYLFAGDDYYPAGGVGDYRNSFNTIDAAIDHFEAYNIKASMRGEMAWDWYQVVDSHNMNVVAHGRHVASKRYNDGLAQA